ncbi:hypothetical protein COP1_020335 [Malus domestica]
MQLVALRKSRAVCRSTNSEIKEGNSTVKDTLAFSKAGLQPTGKSSFPDLSARVTCYLYNRRCSELEAPILDINEESALRKSRIAVVSLKTSSSPRMHSQRTLLRHGEIALEYSSSTADVLPKKLPHLPEEQIRQAKMIPTACGDNVQKKQAEKNAACTIIPAEEVRAEELEKLPHLLGEQIRNCNIPKEQSLAVQYPQFITCK